MACQYKNTKSRNRGDVLSVFSHHLQRAPIRVAVTSSAKHLSSCPSKDRSNQSSEPTVFYDGQVTGDDYMYVDAEWVANQSYGSRIEPDFRPDSSPRVASQTTVESGAKPTGHRTILVVALWTLVMMVILNLAFSVTAIALYFGGYFGEI